MSALDTSRSVILEGDFRGLGPLVGPGSASLIYADPPFGTGRGFDTYIDVDEQAFIRLIHDLLVFAKNALTEHGTLWIHGSFASSERVKSVVKQCPGAIHLTSVMWERIYTPKPNSLGLSGVLDEIVIVSFSRDIHFAPLPFDDDARNLHRSWDGDETEWISGDLSGPRADEHPEDVYAIQNPMTGHLHYPPRGRRWSRSLESMVGLMEQWAPDVVLLDLDDLDRRQRIAGPRAVAGTPGVGWHDLEVAGAHARTRLADGEWPELFFGRTGRGGPRIKRYQDTPGKIASTLWRGKDVGWIQDARAEIAAVVPEARGFSTPKPERLLRRIIEMTTQPGDLVIDPFAGSGTSSVVAHALGRRFATAEMNPEAISTYVMPRLAHVDAGQHCWGDTRLVRKLPFKVRRDEPTRAAEVITSLAAEGRLDHVDADQLRLLKAALRRSDACVVNEPPEPIRFPYTLTRRTM